MNNKVLITQIILVVILLFSLGTRLFRLGIPNTYYFDEVYHGVTAKAYARNDPAGYEWWHKAPEPNTAYEWLHPPVGKLFMALGWKYLGKTAWAWRLPEALFGVFTVWLVYKLSLSLFKSHRLALISALIASLDGLLLTMSRIGMNDIYVTGFIVLTLWAYWEYQKKNNLGWLAISSVAAGLSVSSKWSGVFVIGIVGFLALMKGLNKPLQFIKQIPILILAFLIVPAAIYVGSYGQFWLQHHTVKQFYDLHWQIWYYQTHLKATHAYQSVPWQWVLDVKPVWFWVDYKGDRTGNIYNPMNPMIAWAGLLAMAFVSFRLFLKKQWYKSRELLLIVGYLLVWLPWQFSPRIMFYYHYTPAVPFLSIGLSYALNEWFKEGVVGKTVAVAILAMVIITFIWLFPLWTGMPVPKELVPGLFLISGWK